jgi:hypothetical protein
MQRLWSGAELGEHWTLRADDLALLAALPAGGRLGLAAQLAYWRQNGRFPDDEADLAPAVVAKPRWRMSCSVFWMPARCPTLANCSDGSCPSVLRYRRSP